MSNQILVGYSSKICATLAQAHLCGYLFFVCLCVRVSVCLSVYICLCMFFSYFVFIFYLLCFILLFYFLVCFLKKHKEVTDLDGW